MADPDPAARHRRRAFSAEYKLAVLAEYRRRTRRREGLHPAPGGREHLVSEDAEQEQLGYALEALVQRLRRARGDYDEDSAD